MDEVLKLIVKFLELLPRTCRWLFKHNIECRYARQFESGKGYIVEIHCKSSTAKPVQIARQDIRIQLGLDKSVIKKRDKSKIVYGIKTQVFNSLPVLEAHLSGLSYGNTSRHINVFDDWTPLWFLITVGGPGSDNPSSRFQLGAVYRVFKVQARKRLLWLEYLSVPVRQIPIIAGNEKTKIIDENQDSAT